MDRGRAEKIENILSSREKETVRIVKMNESLTRLNRQVRDIMRIAQDMRQVPNPLQTGDALKEFEDSFRNVLADIAGEIRGLEALRARFRRSTLNIAVVGMTGQGKSRLLQSLSGLTADEIPSASGHSHTGARSVIHHQADAKEAWAEVLFYSEQEFITEILAPYYTRLGLGPAPATMFEFANGRLPTLGAGAANGAAPLGAEHQALAGEEHRALQHIHDHANEFKELLGAPARKVAKDDIRQYVAQTDAAEGIRQNRQLFAYLAVRRVDVYCPFPFDDVGKIAFVDMPGLGQTRVGDEQRMKSMLGDEVDYILFVKMPTPNRAIWDQSDVNLYDVVRDSVPQEYLKRFSMLVLNHNASQGDNLANCQNVSNQVTESSTTTFASVTIANCTSSDDVHHLVLDPVLTHLSRDIAILDREAIRVRGEKFQTILDDVHAIMGDARAAINRAALNTQSHQLGSGLAREQVGVLALALRKLRDQLYADQENEDERYRRAFEDALTQCRDVSNLPTIERIETEEAMRGHFSGAHDALAMEMRTEITSHFSSLNRPLRDMTRDFKQSIVNVLLKDGGWEPIVTGRRAEQLGKMVELTAAYPRLHQALVALEGFELAYWGPVLLQVRKSLGALHPDNPEFGNIGSSATAMDVYHVLEASREATLNLIATELRARVAAPGEIFFAVMDTLREQLISDDIGQDIRDFYAEHRVEIWPAQFRNLQILQDLSGEWHDVLNSMNQTVTEAQDI